MQPAFFSQGLLIGFAIAAPVGPIGVLTIHRTLAEGRLSGLVSGLGAATADALYGCVAGFGLTAISSLLVEHRVGLRWVGGLFLCYLGVRTLLGTPGENPAIASGRGLAGAYGSTFLLTLTNPMTILAFAAVFAGLGMAETAPSVLTALALVAGVFTGSALWWLLLSFGISLLQRYFTPSRLRWIHWCSGGILIGFGAIALVQQP